MFNTSETLQPVVLPHFNNHTLATRPVYMDENARPHHSRAVTAYLQSEAVTSVPWPAMNPDLNPIEHIWDILSRRIHAREPPVQNKGHNSVNIIGNSTPHFPPFFFDPTCMWQQRQRKMGTSEEI